MAEPIPPSIHQGATNVEVYGDFTQIGHVEGDVTIMRELPAYRLEPLPSPSPHGEADQTDEDLSHRQAPSYLLDAARQVVPFRGRETELNDLIKWRDSRARCAIRLLSGPGGQGKSRLAAEFARRSEQAGWMLLTAVERADTHISPTQIVRSGPRPKDTPSSVLVLVDYADRWRLDALVGLLRDLEHRSSQGHVRVLLLARHGPVLWESVASELDRGTAVLSPPVLLGELDPVALRGAAFERAAEAFRSALGAGHGSIEQPTDLAHSDYGSPLTLHMAALAAVYASMENIAVPTRGNLSVYLLRHERRYWRRMYRAIAADGRTQPVPVDTVARTVFLGTLFGPMSTETGQAALRRAGLADSDTGAYSLLAWHRKFYPLGTPSEVLWPLRPDRFGEDYVAYVLDGEDSDDAWRMASELAGTAVGVMQGSGVLSQPALVGDLAGRQFLTVLAAASEDDRHPHLRERLFAILESMPRLAFCISAPVLKFLNHAAPADLLALIQGVLPFSVETLREAAELAVRLLQDLPPDAPLSVRARRMSSLSEALRHIGDRRNALSYAEQAVTLYRQLAETDPPAYLPGLAASLTALGAAHDGIGERHQAFVASQEAINIYRQAVHVTKIMDVGHVEHAPVLAGALVSFSSRLADVGDHQAALDASREAVLVFRALGPILPGAYQEQLAMSLSNLGSALSNLGRGEEAVEACQEAVDVFRPLAEGWPARFLPNLAVALNNLAARKAAIGDARSALPLIEEGIAIFRDLADQYPAAYQLDLARALDNLRLRREELGESLMALQASHEAIAIMRSLAAMDASLYLPPLASMLHDLGIQAKRANSLSAGVAAMDECVRIRRAQADTDPAILPNLAAALRDLGAFLWNIGNRQTALADTEEAVSIFCRQEEDGPGILLHRARSLTNYYGMLLVVGDPQTRLSIADETVAAYRRLVDDDSLHLASLAKALTNLQLERAKTLGAPPGSIGPAADAIVALGEEAVAIYKRLTPSEQSIRLRDLAFALYCLSTARFAAGRKQEALQAMKESVDTYRKLAHDPKGAVNLATALTGLGAIHASL